jgi:hypothetical protein
MAYGKTKIIVRRAPRTPTPAALVGLVNDQAQISAASGAGEVTHEPSTSRTGGGWLLGR